MHFFPILPHLPNSHFHTDKIKRPLTIAFNGKRCSQGTGRQMEKSQGTLKGGGVGRKKTPRKELWLRESLRSPSWPLGHLPASLPSHQDNHPSLHSLEKALHCKSRKMSLAGDWSQGNYLGSFVSSDSQAVKHSPSFFKKIRDIILTWRTVSFNGGSPHSASVHFCNRELLIPGPSSNSFSSHWSGGGFC